MWLTRGGEGGRLSAWWRTAACSIAWREGNTTKFVQTTWKASTVVHGMSEGGKEVTVGRMGGSWRVWGGRPSTL